jgi:hypothetical protein
MKKIFVVLALVLTASMAFAQGGSQTVRVKDDESVCIGPSDALSLYVMNYQTSKSKGAFTQDSTVGMNITATITGTTPDSNGTITIKNAKFPVVYETSLKTYADGTVLLPFQYPILSYFEIKQGQTHYRNIQFDMAIFRKKDANAWGSALELLAQYSKQISLPPSPFTTEFSLFSGFASSAIDNGMASLRNADANNVIPEGSAVIDLNAAPGASTGTTNCAADRSTGLVVVVDSDNGAHPNQKGWVDISQINNYCWIGLLSPTQQVKVAKMDNTGKCAAGDYDVLHNDFKLFTLSAITPDTPATHNGAALLEFPIPVGYKMSTARKKSITKTLNRCKAFGIPDSTCVPKGILAAYQEAQ